MKASELFPGAVVLDQDGNPVVIEPHNLYVMMDCVTPLPISPAVLRGLGFDRMDRNQTSVYFGGGYRAHYAHQLQAMWLHLNGEELVWNQSEYETALKEELS